LLPGAPPGREPVRLLLDQELQRPGEDEVQPRCICWRA
jgi:hypothetical protein